MSENEKLRLLSTLQREEIDSWLTTREREQTYWASQDMRWSYNERRYKKLLQYHPGGILLYLYSNSGQVEHLFDLFRRVFEAIAEQGVNAEERDTFLVLSAEWMSNIILMNGLSVVYYSIKRSCCRNFLCVCGDSSLGIRRK